MPTTYLKVLKVGFGPGSVGVALVSEHGEGLPVQLEGDHVVGEPVVELGLQVLDVVTVRNQRACVAF